MKKILLFCIVFITFGYINAQITLERSDYTAEVDSSYQAFSIDANSWTIPTEGPNQVWDYTSLVLLDSLTITLNHNQDLFHFPNANIEDFYMDPQLVGPVTVEFGRTDYSILNDDAFGKIGIKYDSLYIDLQSVTGSPGDALNYLTSYGYYPNDPGYFAWFPMNAGDVRSSNYIVNNEFLMTVAIFGIDNVPCLNKVTGTSDHEVVGWGSLALIDPTSLNTVSLDVLLMKTTVIEKDSFFLSGAPMPPLILNVFGLSQGQTQTFIEYNFLAKGYPAAVLSGCCDRYQILANLDITSSVEEVTDNPISLKYYPNPATDQLRLEFEKPTNEAWIFALYNSFGQKVFEHVVTQPKGTVSEYIKFNQQYHAGMYFFVLQNGDLEVMSNGLLEIN